jgi:hypothetical protein
MGGTKGRRVGGLIFKEKNLLCDTVEFISNLDLSIV